jgi:hypothetical protein
MSTAPASAGRNLIHDFMISSSWRLPSTPQGANEGDLF